MSVESDVKANIKANASRRKKEASQAKRNQKVSRKGKGRPSAKNVAKRGKSSRKTANNRNALGKKASGRAGFGCRVNIHKNGSTARGALNYIELAEKEHERVYSTVGSDRQGMEATFEGLKSLNKKVKNNVGHLSIALPANTNFDQSRWPELVEFALTELGVDTANHPAVAVKHNDKNHPHVHVVYSRIGFDGKVHDSHNLGQFASAVAERIEQHFILNLTPKDENKNGVKPPTIGQIRAFERTGKVPSTLQIQTALDAVIEVSSSMPEFVENLAQLGVDVQFNLQNKGGREHVAGITYQLGEFKVAANKLGKKYMAYGLKQKGIEHVIGQNENTGNDRAERVIDSKALGENSVQHRATGSSEQPTVQTSLSAVEVKHANAAEPAREPIEPEKMDSKPNNIDLPVIMPISKPATTKPPRTAATAIPRTDSQGDSDDIKASTKVPTEVIKTIVLDEKAKIKHHQEMLVKEEQEKYEQQQKTNLQVNSGVDFNAPSMSYQ